MSDGSETSRRTALQVRGVVKHFDDVVALDCVELTVADGDVLAVLGPSGCGKSTLLRVVAGLETADAGTVTWHGEDLAGLPPHRRDFGLMFQDHALFPHRDVAGNVAFGLRMRRDPAHVVQERTDEVLALVGLAGYGSRPISALSGGERQRVALARALAPSPRLLMLDEPLGALDRALREQLVAELRPLLARVQTTALYVTHDHDEAFTIADEVAVMRAGRIVQAGPPAELWRHPASAFVARFLGWDNVYDDHAIRPEGARIDAEGTPGTVAAVRFQRDRFSVVVERPGGPPITVILRDVPPAPGDSVRVSVDPAAVVPFDEASAQDPRK